VIALWDGAATRDSPPKLPISDSDSDQNRSTSESRESRADVVEQVILRIHPDNAASSAVARSAGFYLIDPEPVIDKDAGPLQTWHHHFAPLD
jgi:hypothetical protein